MKRKIMLFLKCLSPIPINSGIRELSEAEILTVSGGDYWTNVVSIVHEAWTLGQKIGSGIYNSLSYEQQDALGGTIDGMLNMDWDTFYNYWSNQFA